MRGPNPLYLLLSSLFWLCLLANVNGFSFSPPRSPSLPFQTPQVQSPLQEQRPLSTQFRDWIIRSLWGVPKKDVVCTGNTPPPADDPSSLVLARYGEDVVLRFEIKSAKEAEALAAATDVLFLDVWEFTKDWVDIRLSKDIVPSLLGLLPASLQNAHTLLIHSLAHTVYESYPSQTGVEPTSEQHRSFRALPHGSADENNIFFRDYQPLSVILPWMRLLESLFPTHVRMVKVGTTYEGRDIHALRVGVHPTNAEKPLGPRKSIIITGGLHAREWISVSSVNYAAFSLITDYGKSKEITKMVEDFDWIFVPTLNPDGYVYTWDGDRLWRKNRQNTNLGFCKGLDLDHAFGFEWDGQASGSNPCSESFSGEGPFDGVEARQFANWVRNETENNNVKFVGFLDFHSYSQQVLYPYSYSCSSTPPSLENLEELAFGIKKAIHQVGGEKYGVTSACEGSVTSKETKKDGAIWPRIESGGGSALDWFYHEMHVRHAFQIKLRDTGSYGFLLPKKYIVPTGREAYSAISYLGHYLSGNKGMEMTETEGSEAPKLELRSELVLDIR